MIYFTLPDFYQKFKINNFLQILSQQNKDFFKESVTFIYTKGNFPYNYWNGFANYNTGKGAYYDDFENCSQLSHLPLRLCIDNTYLDKEDYSNCMNEEIFKTNENGSNILQICDFNLIDYLKNKYPLYDYILSKNNYHIMNYEVEQLNSIINLKIFNLIELPEYLNENFEFLNKISSRKCIELIVNPICDYSCKFYSHCFDMHQKNIYNFSKIDIFNDCNNKKNNNIITIKKIKEKYLPLGINHFSFNSFKNLNDLETLSFYLKYFIKTEYHKEVEEKWMQYRKMK